MSLDRESICEFVKFENSEKNNKYRAGSMKKKISEVWQPTVLKVVVCTKMECYTAGLSRKKKHRTKNSSALRDLIEYSIKKN